MKHDVISLRDQVRTLEKQCASLQRQLVWREDDWLRLKKLYEPDVTPDPAEVSKAHVIESETAQRQKSAAALASGEGDEAEYLENARRLAWQAVNGDKLYFEEPVEIGGVMLGEKYPSGWPESLPKHVVVNRYVQLSDDGTSLASWEAVAGGHQIGHPGAPCSPPVPLASEKPKGPATWLQTLAEKRGLKLVQ